MAPHSPIPPPRPDDDEDVHWALSTASALWARGDAAESIKWLRRAAETASDQNRDLRSLELFKAAADATSMVQRPSAPTAPLPVPPAPPPPVNPAPPAPARPATGPTGTISMQIPPAAASPAPGQSAPPPAVRPSAPMPAPQASPPGRAPLPQRAAGGGPPAGTARAAAAQANAQAQVTRAAPGFSPQRPAAATAGGALKRTLPSEGSTPPPPNPQPARGVPAARPSPGTGAGAAPSSAAKRADSRKPALDARFHFPDEEVTVQRDLAALKKPRPVHTEVSAEDAAAAAATQRAPLPATPPAARTLISTSAGSAAAVGATQSTVRGLQPLSRTPTPIAQPAQNVRHAIVNEQTAAEPDREHTPIDDLDEQTSVLSGDEAELDFEGSATGETSAAMLASIEQSQLEQDSNLDDGVTGEESSDPRHGGLMVPSVRPEPMGPRPAPVGDHDASAWTAIRVAVRRDARGIHLQTLARGAAPPPGAIAVVLVAQDDDDTDALLQMLEG